MKKPLLAAVAALWTCSQARAAVKTFPVDSPSERSPVAFRMEIIGDRTGLKSETLKKGRPFVAAENGENYTIRLYNPLPVRVAVNLTIDGLNSISGKPSGIADGEKWVIPANGSIELRGWQVSGDQARRFFFTDKPKSYAKWRGDQTGRDLAANCGVIGAAFFWSRSELAEYYAELRARQYDFSPRSAPAAAFGEGGLSSLNNKADAASTAGTGMGERESHPTTEVAFNYDTGMYRLSQALVVYYDFAPEPQPNPFPALTYAPEMP